MPDKLYGSINYKRSFDCTMQVWIKTIAEMADDQTTFIEKEGENSFFKIESKSL